MKKVVRQLLEKLKWGLLVLDWKKRQQTRAAVEVTINGELDVGLSDVYDRKIYSEKCSRVFQHIYESYQGAGVSIYEAAGVTRWVMMRSTTVTPRRKCLRLAST